MKDFSGKIAVVTGGGSGMGRELVRQLAREGCHVAMCDVSAESMAETKRLADAEASRGARVTAHVADVGVESDVEAFRDAVTAAHETDHINLLFNNAGIGGGGGFVAGDRAEWERTFGVCWYGVYYSARTFMPMLVASESGYIINTSSINGLWASLGPGIPHTAYCAAKFAVKGFTEALITDLAINAPHVKAAVVMPGHVGTSIAVNTLKLLEKDGLNAAEIAALRERWVAAGQPVGNLSDDEIQAVSDQRAVAFRDNAPCTAERAAGIILDGVREERWRILVGEDAAQLDRAVRAEPERAYQPDFMLEMRRGGLFGSTREN